MPTYQYACTACDHRFDAVQAFSDDALTSCPECEGRLRKVFSSVGIVFKGSGFYRTDSRAGAVNGSDSSKSDSAKSDSGSSDSGKSDSGKSESTKSDSGKKSESGSSSSGSSSSDSKSSSSSGSSTPATSAASS